jgi:hypothetical protein
VVVVVGAVVVPATVVVTVCVVVTMLVTVGIVYVAVTHATFGEIVPTLVVLAKIVWTGLVAHTVAVPVEASAMAARTPATKTAAVTATRMGRRI